MPPFQTAVLNIFVFREKVTDINTTRSLFQKAARGKKWIACYKMQKSYGAGTFCCCCLLVQLMRMWSLGMFRPCACYFHGTYAPHPTWHICSASDTAHIRHGAYPTWYISDLVHIRHGVYPTWRISNMAHIRHGAYLTWRIYDMVHMRHGVNPTWRISDMALIRRGAYPHGTYSTTISSQKSSFLAHFSKPFFDSIWPILDEKWVKNDPTTDFVSRDASNRIGRICALICMYQT